MDISLRILLLIGVYGGFLYASQTSNIRSVLTFNANLDHNPIGAATSDNHVARRTALINYLMNSTEEAVCLQGVQYADDLQAIMTGVAGSYDHTFSSLQAPDGTLTLTEEPRCDIGSTQALGSCVVASLCSNEAECRIACGEGPYEVYLASNDQDCFDCIGTNIDDILAPDTSNVGLCTTPQALAAPENANGLLILSRRPLTDTNVVPFHPETNDVGYLEANVGGDYTFVCTHLTSEFDGNAALIPGFANFEAQALNEAQQLVTEFSDNPNTVIAGDMGSGPAVTGVPAELPGIYNVLAAAFANVSLGVCDFCVDGTNAYNTAGSSAQVSHVFGTNLVRLLCSELALDPSEAVTTAGLPLSDHYGVSSQFIPADYGYYNTQSGYRYKHKPSYRRGYYRRGSRRSFFSRRRG